MPSNTFLTQKQEKNIIDAINRAENKTSGEIRIHIEHHCKKEPLERAASLFHELGMTHTQLQNGVLIYIASEDRKAAVFAGKSIHEQVGKTFWDDVLAILLERFKEQSYEEGIVRAIDTVGNKLKELFPHQRNDVNELSNEISYNNND